LISRRAGSYLLVALTIAVGIACVLAPRSPQPLSYHHFADQRSWLGIPNFGDVVSNILFAVFGVAGLVYLGGKIGQKQFIDSREK
jgi:hypothetical protein